MRRIEERKGSGYHRRRKTAAGGGNMTWQGDSVSETQLTYTICVFVMLYTQKKRKEKKNDAEENNSR